MAASSAESVPHCLIPRHRPLLFVLFSLRYLSISSAQTTSVKFYIQHGVLGDFEGFLPSLSFFLRMIGIHGQLFGRLLDTVITHLFAFRSTRGYMFFELAKTFCIVNVSDFNPLFVCTS